MNLADLPFRPGDVIADKYAVDRVLGQGGMGVVVAARHLDLDVLVALKFLLPEFAADPGRRARFAREARAAIRIKSEHVAHVLDLGKVDESTPFIVMEYLDGTNVADRLAQSGPFAVAQAVDLLLQACAALAEAHALGVVHRDLKPSNLFLCRKGDGATTLKVMDFGISKVTDTFGDRVTDPSVTKTGALVGSPAYMAPEQIRDSKNVDARADVWSLGVLLFELLTARHPFENHSVGGLLSAIIASSPLPLSVAWPEAPAGLDAVVERALRKSPDDRYQSAAEFADAIRPFADSPARFAFPPDRAGSATADLTVPSGVSHRAPALADSSVAPHSIALDKTVGIGSEGTEPSGVSERNHPPTEPAARGGRRWWPAAAIVLALLAMGIGGWQTLRRPAPEELTGGPPAASPPSIAVQSESTAQPSLASPSALTAPSDAAPPPPASDAGSATEGSRAQPAASRVDKPNAVTTPDELRGLIDDRR